MTLSHTFGGETAPVAVGSGLGTWEELMAQGSRLVHDAQPGRQGGRGCASWALLAIDPVATGAPSVAAGGFRAYCAVMAPSATSTVPVTKDDSSDARNRAQLAISTGSPGRPMGWNESIVAYTCARPPSISAWA